ncbi:Murein L,D-transpeptidase YafK [Desulfuromusa kysingii]|uniref:Murein L,D-transpeptidase YafK n=1 Tax=Desulfuromusa kysingii TaxID=37625 RepID=A0A1H3Y9W3_9BACT|nr:L,D-transpeptidase family protein [Desulfuromusa kysingii]SEA08340.1 Murein L,D-transpeptidase YafK [Desulfuromusa kysingii]
MLKRITISVLIVGLLGLTGVKVGALWTQQQVQEGPTAPSFPSFDQGIKSPQSGEVNSQVEVLFDRLNRRLERNPDDYEASLLKGLLSFQVGGLDDAITELRTLTQRAPKFQLAHLILGDLLMARFNQVDAFGHNGLIQTNNSTQEKRIQQLQSEARARLQGYLFLVDGVEVPRALLALSSETEYALLVDKSKNRLYVYHNSGPGLSPELVDDFYVVLGKKTGEKYREGDLKTPSGVYFVTSYLPDEKLPPLYGSGAFPVNYPNEYDHRLRKTGKGIWLHGTDKSLYSRPPLDSEGCVVLTNEEFTRIGQYVEIGRTPIIISESVDWVSSREWLDQNIEVQAALENWRQNWERADLNSYLDMYAEDFWSKKYDKEGWATYKRQVFSSKKFQKIDLSDISVLSYPGDKESRPMVVANFVQHYRSNNFNGNTHKRLYMVKEQGDWKVLYEGRQ